MHRAPLLRVVLLLLACLLLVAARAAAGSSVEVDADGSTHEENKKGHRLPNGQPVSAVAEVLYDEGVALLEDKDEAGAASKFLAAMQEEPMYMQAIVAYGKAVHQTKPVIAEKTLRKALEIDPNHKATAEAFVYLGLILKRRGQMEEALAMYRHAIERRWSLASAHYNLGIALAELDRHEEAIAAYEHSLELAPTDAETLLGLGQAYFWNGNGPRAAKRLRRALELGLPSADFEATANFYLMRALESAGRADEILLQDNLVDSKGRKLSNYERRKKERRQRKKRRKRMQGKRDAIILSYQPSARVARNSNYGFCRMLASAAHNRVSVQVLGLRDTWSVDMQNEEGMALDAIRRFLFAAEGEETEHGKLRIDPDTILVYVNGNTGVFVEDLDTIIDRYLAFGRGDAWVLSGDCNCLPFMTQGNNRTCDRFPGDEDNHYRFLNSGAWIGRARTVARVLRDANLNAKHYVDTWNKTDTQPTLSDVRSASQVLASYLLSGRVPEMEIDTEAALFMSFSQLVYPLPRAEAQEDDDSSDNVGAADVEDEEDTELLARKAMAGIRRHTNPSITKKCDPLADVDDRSPRTLRNWYTLTYPAIIHFPPGVSDSDAYNRVAARMWFNQIPKAVGVPLAGRKLARHPHLHTSRFAWNDAVPARVATFFREVSGCTMMHKEEFDEHGHRVVPEHIVARSATM